MSQDFRGNNSGAILTTPAAADLTETAWAIHSSNLPRNGSQIQYTYIIVTTITQPEYWYSFCLTTVGSGLNRPSHCR